MTAIKEQIKGENTMKSQMKCVNKLWVLSLILLNLSACGDSADGEEVGEKTPYEDVNTLDGVDLELDKDVYGAEGDRFTLTVKNDSDQEISYGVSFTIEKQVDDEWYTVEPEEEMMFIMIAHVLEPDREQEEEINMAYYEPLSEGRYRVVRQIEGEVLTAEFEVN